MQKVSAGSVEESTYLSGLDRFRVRRRCGVRVQRSHRRTLSTKSDGARDEPGSRARDEPTRWAKPTPQPWQTRFSSSNRAALCKWKEGNFVGCERHL